MPWEEGERDSTARLKILRSTENLLHGSGYGYIETPIFESTELFARGVGTSTDIVQKEMFSFEDKGGRALTLRPEGTASICRAYIEQGMQQRPQPVKLWYSGPFFRHERAQTGRYRQFSQIGAEALGSDDPSLDAELILLAARVLRRARVPKTHVRLRISSLGQPEDRHHYLESLRAYLRAHSPRLPEHIRSRFEMNPLRAFDADDGETRAVMQGAPKLADYLNGEDRAHFAEVVTLLEEAGLKPERDDSLVRGLDYYTRTVFEFESVGPRLGAQKAIAGGGRYDRLIQELGGPPTPGIGWAIGIERTLLAAGGRPSKPPRVVYVAASELDSAHRAFHVAQFLRDKRLNVEMGAARRSPSSHLKHADRIGASLVVFVGPALELVQRHRSRSQPVKDMADLPELIRSWQR